MTEEGSSNSDLDLNQIILNIIQFKNNFNKLQLDFMEEKEKTVKIEVKNQSLENEIKNLKEKMEEANVSFDKKIDELSFKLKQLNNIICKQVCFVQIENKWKEFTKIWKCCENNCINKDNPYGNCIEGNGFLINDKHSGNNWFDKANIVFAQNQFKKPKFFNFYSLFYFEVKCKIEGKGKRFEIGLRNCNGRDITFGLRNYFIKNKFLSTYSITNEICEEFKLENFSWNDNDIFGCGLVYPPTNKINEFPYLFFTQNGKQIGKALSLKRNYDNYTPCILLLSCSMETNFGNDLDSKPFIYDITKHYVQEEFYSDFFLKFF